jgi:hypothetical protein
MQTAVREWPHFVSTAELALPAFGRFLYVSIQIQPCCNARAPLRCNTSTLPLKLARILRSGSRWHSTCGIHGPDGRKIHALMYGLEHATLLTASSLKV